MSNRGDSNSGDSNSGDRNSGDSNSGISNSGYRNSGYRNSGISNSGNSNRGDSNSGDSNSGYRNSGDRNRGDSNSGISNSGHSNSGNRNSGDRNSGNWNSGNWNSGWFCTETPPARLFDQPTHLTHGEVAELVPRVNLDLGTMWVADTDMTDDERNDNPFHTTTGGFLRVGYSTIQEAFAAKWRSFDDETKQRFINLPNFDSDKFLQCTGVDVRKEGRSVTLEDGTSVTMSQESYDNLVNATKEQ